MPYWPVFEVRKVALECVIWPLSYPSQSVVKLWAHVACTTPDKAFQLTQTIDLKGISRCYEFSFRTPLRPRSVVQRVSMQARANTGSMPATTYVSIGQIKALGAKLDLPETSGGCETQGGEGKASCGSSGGPDDRPQEIWDKGVRTKTSSAARRCCSTVSWTGSKNPGPGVHLARVRTGTQYPAAEDIRYRGDRLKSSRRRSH
jgi:hypothetical protein